MRALTLTSILVLTACGSSTPPASPQPQPAADTPAPAADTPAPAADTPAPAADAHLPPPFTADQLRAGLPVGTEIRLRVEAGGQPAIVQHWRFTAADASGCTIAARILSADDGALIKDEGEGTSTWAELESHAHFPADRTTRTDATVTVPAGTYEAWKFEVAPANDGEPTSTFYFARTLPGPPVLMEVKRGDQLVTRMELVSRTQP